MQNALRARQAFASQFNSHPRLFASPGRLNLLGEHTDYNQGFVLPGAIDKEICLAIAPNNSQHYHFVSLDMADTWKGSAIEPVRVMWVNYLLGVIAQIRKTGRQVPGFDFVFGGDLPIGAGVSSSAALECGLLYALNQLYSLELNTTTMAAMAQQAEHEYAGVKCGIMDQFAVLHGARDQVIKLDCRSLEYSLHRLDLTDHKLVLCDSLVKHSHASSAYNKRREQCEAAVAGLARFEVDSLRDAEIHQIDAIEADIGAEAARRARYVIQENQRVSAAVQALQHGDLASLGRLMYATHYGLRDDFEISCAELDDLIAIAGDCEGVLGARMMGGGFGGCTLNLVTQAGLNRLVEQVSERYYQPRGLEAAVMVTQLNDGTRLLEQ